MEPESPPPAAEALAPSTVARAAGDTQARTERPPPAGLPRVENYEILHLLGRGGMGTVYKARQVSLDRVVALKMIRADLGAGEEERARFHIEAESAARLQHPNIIQVYEVGNVEGVPYIALEFVGGGSLADHLNGTPLPPRQAAELVEVLAWAVHHAHERGVVHRDLKPANILLAAARGPLSIVPDAETPWAEDRPRPVNYGHPKITDFGLARCLDSPSPRQTRSGAVLGTPSYMAPEQASGKDEGPACDVYSLGAILYELLTGRPPFVGPTPMDTAVQVVSEEPVPPHRLQGTVPRDLETVCLQCLQKDPQRRYVSAQALAEDCSAFLRGEPVQARPASVWERGVKWARRRPAAAGLVAVSALAILALLLGAWWYNGLLRAERDEAERQRRAALAAQAKEEIARGLAEKNEREARHQQEQAAQQRDKARAWFNQARAAVDTMLTRVGEQMPPVTLEAARVRRQLLEDALNFYQGFLKEGGDDPVIRRETARAYRRVGDIYQKLGELEGSADAYRLGADQQERLVRDFPGQADYARDLGELQHALGLALFALGQEQAAEKAHRRGVEVLEGLTSRFPNDPTHRRGLANQWRGLGSLLLHSGRWKEAESAARRSLELLDQLTREDPDDLVCRHLLAVSRSNLSIVLTRTGRHAEAEELARQSIELHRTLVQHRPTFQHRQDLGHALGNWSLALRRLERTEEAERAVREELDIRRQLAREFPHVSSCRANLAQALTSLGLVLNQSRPVEANKLHREAIALREKLVQEFPGVPGYRSDLGAALHNLAAGKQIKPAEARDLLRQAITHQQAALKGNPRHNVYQQFLRNHHLLVSDAYLALGDHAEASGAARELAKVFPKSSLDSFRAAVQTARCIPLVEKDTQLDGEQRRRLVEGYAAQAVAHLRRALRNGYANRAELANIPALAPLRGRADFKALVSGS
ncbi:MAG: serine/threonine-protein kinase [Gemmataceae bacterium]|nr:serine/threonine-protein kinase [Gemmataceae bacterium]